MVHPGKWRLTWESCALNCFSIMQYNSHRATKIGTIPRCNCIIIQLLLRLFLSFVIIDHSLTYEYRRTCMIQLSRWRGLYFSSNQCTSIFLSTCKIAIIWGISKYDVCLKTVYSCFFLHRLVFCYAAVCPVLHFCLSYCPTCTCPLLCNCGKRISICSSKHVTIKRETWKAAGKKPVKMSLCW